MSDVVIKLRENGPILITGTVVLTDHLGRVYDTSGQANIALCRCGSSQKKPFCDGTHKTCGFVGQDPASDLSPNSST